MAFIKKVVNKVISDPTVPVVNGLRDDYNFAQQLSVAGDDMMVSSDGSSTTVGTNIFGYLYFGCSASSSFNPLYPVLKFSTGGQIPQGSTINSAVLTLEVNGTSGTSNFKIGCQDVDAAVVVASDNNPIDQSGDWPMTSAFTTCGAVSSGTNTVVVTTAIQEVINRAGWDEGFINVFAIDLAGSGGTTNAYWQVDDVSKDDPSKLEIVWSY